MDVKIREATLEDIEILDDFQNKLGQYEKQFDSVIKKEGRIRYHPLEKLHRLIESEDALVLLADFNDQIIGSGFCEIEKNKFLWSIYPKRAWIEQMFVEGEYRKKGVGEKIMKKLLDWLHKRKIYDIRIRVYTENPAVNAYLKYGFEEYVHELRKLR